MKKITLLFAALLIAVTSFNAQNLALDKTATGSTENQAAGNAIDGNTGTRWESASEDPQWITIDLEQTYSIGRIVLNWEGAYGKEYKIQVSDNNTDWTDIYTETNSDGGFDDFNVTGTGRYVRMYGTVRGTVWGYSLFEFEVYAPLSQEKDATLADLKVDGVTIDGFSSGTTDYTYGVIQGTTTVPTVTVAASNSNVTPNITNATSIPGTTTITVRSQDLSTTETYTVKFVVDTPINAAPVPTHNSANVIPVYSDAYTNNLLINSNPYWGQSTVVSEVQLESDNALKYAGLNYQGTEFTSTDISVMNYVHLDYFTGDATEFQFFVISEGPLENAYDIALNDGITTGEWVSLDIPLTEYTVPDLTKAFQFKTVGNGTIYLDNLYFWKGSATDVSAINDEVFQMVPNPVVNYMILKSSSTIERVEIFALSGGKIVEVLPNTSDAKVNLSSLRKGIYIAKVTMNGRVKTQKFIKQ